MTGRRCLFCGQPFDPRRTGGKRQRFCAEGCRRAFAGAALAWAERQAEAGSLGWDELLNGTPTSPRWSTKVESAPVPENVRVATEVPSDVSPIEWRQITTINPSADDTWLPTEMQPDPAGVEAVPHQLKEADGSLYDVVAWEAARPETWWLRYGRATFLGEDCIDDANRGRQPVWLVPTPAEQIAHEPPVCCILRWDVDVPAILGLARYGWLTTSAALAKRVRAACKDQLAVNIRLVD